MEFIIFLIDHTLSTRVTDEIGALCAFQDVTVEGGTERTPILLVLPFFLCYRAIHISLNIRISLDFYLRRFYVAQLSFRSNFEVLVAQHVA